MALGVLQAIRERFGVDAASLEDLPADHGQTFELLDTQTAFASPPYACYSLPDRLSSYSWINVHTSSYRPALPWGAEIGDHATNQNLEALTFEEGRFDLVMTSDVLEHVRLYEDAHREIARVVKPGGAYIFTVPHSRGMAEHLVRIAVHDRDDATADEFVLPPEYHGSADPDEGPVLSYRVFGASIDQELNDIGFDVTYGVDADPIHAIFETELFYCHRRDRTPAEPD